MYHLVENLQTQHFVPIAFLHVSYGSLKGDYIPKLLNWLVFIIETDFVFRKVETEYRYTIYTSFVSKGLQQRCEKWEPCTFAMRPATEFQKHSTRGFEIRLLNILSLFMQKYFSEIRCNIENGAHL
jgi:hypothetical protein